MVSIFNKKTVVLGTCCLALAVFAGFVLLNDRSPQTSANAQSQEDPQETQASAITQIDEKTQIDENSAPAVCNLRNQEAGRVQASELDEISGLMYSKKHQALWAHNDNREDNRLIALSPTGERLASVAVAGADLDNWEDSAIVPGKDDAASDVLYLGAIGDNDFDRMQVTIFRVEEPALADKQTQQPDRIDLVYPDRPRDAEAMFIDPLSGDIYILQKAHNDGPAQLFTAAAPGEGDQTIELRPVKEIDFVALGNQVGDDPTAKPKPHLVTSADVSRDGTTIAIRTYGQVWIWQRDVSQPLEKAFDSEPCQAKSVKERQGEALALTPDGAGYVTISEGASPAIHIFE